MALDDEELRQIRLLFEQTLTARSRIDAEKHHVHHQWIDRQQEKERKREEMWGKVRTHVLGWGAVGAIIALVSMIGDKILDWIRNAPPPGH